MIITVLAFLGIIVSLFFLHLSARIFMHNTLTLTARTGISPYMVGILVVGLGTSIPELALSISAILANDSYLVVANAIGSNIANILLVLAVGVLFTQKVLHFRTVKRTDLLWLCAATVLFMLFMIGGISRWEGVILIVTYLAYITYIVKTKAKQDIHPKVHQSSFLTFTLVTIAILTLIGVVVFAKTSIWSALAFTSSLGIQNSSFIGQTILALGTSLPELAVTIEALRENRPLLALGNIIGSNMANLLLIVGLPALVVSLNVSSLSYMLGGFFLVFATLAFSTLFIKKEMRKTMHSFI